MATLTIIGIVGNRNSQEFNKLTPMILEYMENPQTQFIFSDREILAARFLDARKFRRCLIYHTGDTPKHRIGGYPTRAGFLSYAEIEAAIKTEANFVI